MFRTNFKIVFRNLGRDRQFTMLNLIGLATGMACALLIYLWVKDELSVDKFNEKDARIYEVMKAAPNADGTITVLNSTPGLLAQEMAKALPEVEKAVSVRPQMSDEGGCTVAVSDKHLRAAPQFVDKDFFNIFSYKIIEGNSKTVLADKYGALISDQLALKLFNTNQNIIGRTFSCTMNEFSDEYKVSGVFKAPPSNASEKFDLVFNYDLYATKEKESIGNWENNSTNTFLLLKEGTNIKAFNDKIKNFIRQKLASFKQDSGWVKWEGHLFLQRFSDRYLHSNFENGVQSGGKIEYVRLFSIIAIFILVIACINFMNLSTAKAAKRVREVGIKKVIGATRRSLIVQYYSESLLMSFSSLLISLLIAPLLLPVFRQITGKEINFQFTWGFALAGIFLAFATGILAGSYPALYLTGFKPATVLKGKLTAFGETFVRRGLVVFQFSVSIVLIVAVMVIYQQMKLIQTKDLGYNKENTIRFLNGEGIQASLPSFFAEVKKLPGVIGASGMNGDFLGMASHGGSGISWEGKDPNIGIEYYGNDVNYGFIEMMGLQMAGGRAFSKDFNDSAGVIFNESAIRAMGLKNPIGKKVSLWSDNRTIVGVVKDYHFQSLNKKITPSFLTLSTHNDYTLVKMKPGKEIEVLRGLETIFKKYASGLALDYTFLDSDYNTLYAAEQKLSILSKYFAGIAILISCLGLFGLAAFTAQKRQKEIGIRKVIGASVGNVVSMLSRDFLKLILISILLAFPLSWWAMNNWLDGFAYRVHISLGIFLLAGIVTIIITLATISFQSIKAAIANPVKSLRTE